MESLSREKIIIIIGRKFSAVLLFPGERLLLPRVRQNSGGRHPGQRRNHPQADQGQHGPYVKLIEEANHSWRTEIADAGKENHQLQALELTFMCPSSFPLELFLYFCVEK